MDRPWPADVKRLFWEVEPRSVDLRCHADYVMERVMVRGSLEAMRWLRSVYTTDELAEFLERQGHRLPPRDCAYWRLIAGLPPDDAPGGASPPWTGP